MAGKRKHHTPAFKAPVALNALKGDRTINELAGQYGVHPPLIHGCWRQLLTAAHQFTSTAASLITLASGPTSGGLIITVLGSDFLGRPLSSRHD